jgi:3-dehydroquinate synthase
MYRADLQVNLGDRAYPIVVTSGELDTVGDFARSRSAGGQALLVCDSHTEPLYGNAVIRSFERVGFQAMLRSIPAGEQSKSAKSAEVLYHALHDLKAERTALVVALGGGVIGDLAGFVAATYARGVPFLQVPTTLLAQVDSSVGGKVGINYEAPDGQVIKNMIGAFHQPVGVFADTGVLRTLPPRELRAGLAEVVKYGVILDADFFRYLESNADAILALDPAAMGYVVGCSCRLKAAVVEADEREVTERRAILNYGHTFAHAIEAVTRQYAHGEAVAIGMLAASRLAEQTGRVPGEVTARQFRLLQRFGLPAAAPGLDTTALLDAMRYDKKSKAGRLRFVLPQCIGAVEIANNIDESTVRAVLAEMISGIS